MGLYGELWGYIIFLASLGTSPMQLLSECTSVPDVVLLGDKGLAHVLANSNGAQVVLVGWWHGQTVAVLKGSLIIAVNLTSLVVPAAPAHLVLAQRVVPELTFYGALFPTLPRAV